MYHSHGVCTARAWRWRRDHRRRVTRARAWRGWASHSWGCSCLKVESRQGAGPWWITGSYPSSRAPTRLTSAWCGAKPRYARCRGWLCPEQSRRTPISAVASARIRAKATRQTCSQLVPSIRGNPRRRNIVPAAIQKTPLDSGVRKARETWTLRTSIFYTANLSRESSMPKKVERRRSMFGSAPTLKR